MLPFGVTTPATVPQMSEIPEGLMNNPVYCQPLLKTAKSAEMQHIIIIIIIIIIKYVLCLNMSAVGL